MSRLTIGIFGALALSLTFGAAQLASGRDLSEAQDILQGSVTEPLIAAGNAVNRGAKADRMAGRIGSPGQTRTIALRLEGFADTSFLVRVPSGGGLLSRTKSENRKLTVACEPVVSVLTEVAKRLQPGRCVT